MRNDHGRGQSKQITVLKIKLLKSYCHIAIELELNPLFFCDNTFYKNIKAFKNKHEAAIWKTIKFYVMQI